MTCPSLLPVRAVLKAEGNDQHVCPAAEDGPVAASELPVPVVNYMDLTNDTCRWGR